MPFGPGNNANPKGCPKGAHHIGRPSSKVKRLAKSRSLAIMRRLAKIAEGENLEQVVTESGETIDVPAAVREQIKASEVVLKVADELGPEVEVNTGETVINFSEMIQAARKDRGLPLTPR